MCLPFPRFLYLCKFAMLDCWMMLKVPETLYVVHISLYNVRNHNFMTLRLKHYFHIHVCKLGYTREAN